MVIHITWGGDLFSIDAKEFNDIELHGNIFTYKIEQTKKKPFDLCLNSFCFK